MAVRMLAVLAAGLAVAADAARGPEIPDLNQKVLAFARDNLGKKVGDGECTALADQALRRAGAKLLPDSPQGEYVWGRLVRTVRPRQNLGGAALPGDVVQFRDARLVRRTRRGTLESTYPLHTAVIAAVKDDGKVLELLHQNFGGSGADDEQRRKVQRTTLRLEDLRQGTLKIYRPLPREGGRE